MFAISGRFVALACLLAMGVTASAQQPPLPVPQPPSGPMSPEPLNTTPPLQPAPSPADGSVEFPVEPLLAPFDWSQVRLGGQFRVEPNVSNYPFHPLTLPTGLPNQAYVFQRYRLWMTYTPTENVEGYLQMQVGQIPWGTNYDFNKNFGATFAGDRVGIELRRAWLALKDENLGKLRIGILDWHDSFGDTLASSDYDFNTGGVD